MKHILVPCDFSQPSREAFKMAVDLARKSHGEITVLHAIYIPLMYDPTFAGGLPLAYDPEFRSNVEDDIKAGFEKLKSIVPTDPIPVSLEIIYGDLISSVKQVVNQKNIDLLVMGTTGASGLQEIIVGSNTEKVVRHATIPVLAVHRACALKSIKKILLPTDLKFDKTVFIEKVKELQQFFGATLHLLWINTSELGKSEATEALEEYVKHYKLSNVAVHARSHLNEARGIIDYAYDVQADLVVMATHARKGLEHLFSGSVTEKVVNHLQLPVWTFALKH